MQKLFLNQEITVLELLYLISNGSSETRVWLGGCRSLDNISCLLDAEFLVDSFKGGEVNLHEGLGNVQHSYRVYTRNKKFTCNDKLWDVINLLMC